MERSILTVQSLQVKFQTGIELAGFLNFYPAERIQLLGRTETSFVASMDEGIRLE